MLDDGKDLSAVRKELQQVKSRAVGKIKALQAQVEALQTQLAERPPVGPPDESASSDGSEKSAASGGFVKVGMSAAGNDAAVRALEAELHRRAAELSEREEGLQRRETELSEREEGLQRRGAGGGGAAAPAWHAQLLAGLRSVQANCAQAELAYESVSGLQ